MGEICFGFDECLERCKILQNVICDGRGCCDMYKDNMKKCSFYKSKDEFSADRKGTYYNDYKN